MLTKTKDVLDNGSRLENASWRRWFQKKYNIKQISQKELALLGNMYQHDHARGYSDAKDSSGSSSSTSPGIHGILKTSKVRGERLAWDLIGQEGQSHMNGEGLRAPSSSLEETKKQWEQETTHLVRSPPSARRCLKMSVSTGAKKTVCFDETQNKTAFVR